MDFVMDSVSVATSFKDKLGELGIIFCSISEAVKEHPGRKRSSLFVRTGIGRPHGHRRRRAPRVHRERCEESLD